MGKKLDLSEIVVGGDQKAPDVVRELVERFDYNREAYHSPAYKETQAREEFIDPFFGAMGWDIQNRQHFAEPYKQVILEDAIKVGGLTKAPDYCFRIGGQRKFFVEAKKPYEDVATDSALAFQLRRYAYSARLPLSILTDFEEFAVYDGLVEPRRNDPATAARVLSIGYRDYVEQWGLLYGIFSPDSIQRGSFDKFAGSRKNKRGTAPVDEAFLSDIESWRDALAHNIALRNAERSQRELNFAVGRTIDRIIFLRMCEDRGIEEYETAWQRPAER